MGRRRPISAGNWTAARRNPQRSANFDALGDWSEGVENSILATVHGPVRSEDLRYASAQFGLLANQKQVLIFGTAGRRTGCRLPGDLPS